MLKKCWVALQPFNSSTDCYVNHTFTQLTESSMCFFTGDINFYNYLIILNLGFGGSFLGLFCFVKQLFFHLMRMGIRKKKKRKSRDQSIVTESTSMVVWEWGQGREGRGKDYKRTQGDEYVHFLGCCEGFADVPRSNFSNLHFRCVQLHVNYSLIKFSSKW